MKAASTLAVVALALAAGYFAGQHTGAPAPETANRAAAVDAGDGAKTGGKKLLYYRNPMGLPDTSPVPKKDPMGMDYIPVYEGDDAGDSGIRVSAEKVQKLGVRSEPVVRRAIDASVRASGRIEIDERRVATVAAKFEGYIERLHVSTSGQPVGRGQPLFEVYSPELVSAQREYAIAAQGVGQLQGAGGEAQAAVREIAQASLMRLQNWDIPPAQIKALAASGEVRRTLTLVSPAAGVVVEKKAVQGMRFMPGEPLFQIADTSIVWVLADVFEQDIAAVATGQAASIRVNAYPGEVFTGRVTYVYPTLKAETRTVPVRVELPNPHGRLKPGMFAEVELAGGDAATVLAVPVAAVIDGGTRQVVIVESGDGRFEPRAVKLGRRGGEFVEIRDGVREGERVVTAANFLIDAESNLKAALGGMQKADAAKPTSVGHHAEGTLNAVDAAAGSVTVSHGPVPSLNWPPMKMDFILANPALAAGIAPGTAVVIEFVERAPGEWVITAMRPKAAGHAH